MDEDCLEDKKSDNNESIYWVVIICIMFSALVCAAFMAVYPKYYASYQLRNSFLQRYETIDPTEFYNPEYDPDIEEIDPDWNTGYWDEMR